MKVVVVGGGIGGLTTALALSADGHTITVLEQSPVLSPLGAGLQISPNARRVLEHLGLGNPFAGIETRPSRIVLRRWSDDSVIGQSPLTGVHEEKFGLAYANVARNDLARILHDACATNPRVSVKFDTHVTGIDRVGPSPVVHCNETSFEADLVVGADGIHSVVRAIVAGKDTPRFSGWSAFRAQVPRAMVEHLPVETTNRLGPGAHVVSYFIGKDQSHLNLVFIAEETEWMNESWTERTSIESLREAFVGWSPQLQQLIDAVEEPVYRWALYDREPLAKWCDGPVALLGDAAHPMLPFMAQGACQAIEDAAVLARCLQGVGPVGDEVADALQLYESTRISRATRVQTGSFRNRILYHLPDGDEQQARDAMFGSEDWSRATDWVYGYDSLTAPLG